MDTSIIENIEAAIDCHPSKLDCWGLLECNVHGDGGFYLEFYYAPHMAKDSIKSSVYMRVTGTESPAKVADAVWDFFGAYEGAELLLLEGRAKWRQWFGYSDLGWYIASVFAESEGLRDEEFYEYAERVESRITDEMVAAYNELITEHMLHGNTLVASAKLCKVMPEVIYEAITHADAIHEAKVLKTTNPIIDLNNE